jgi:hypothetical protein
MVKILAYNIPTIERLKMKGLRYDTPLFINGSENL